MAVPTLHLQTVHQVSYGPICEPLKAPQSHTCPGERGPPRCGSCSWGLAEEECSSDSISILRDAQAEVTSHLDSSNPAPEVLKGGTALADWYCFTRRTQNSPFHPSTYTFKTNKQQQKKNLVKCAVSSDIGFHQSLQLYSSHSQTQQESKLLGGPREDAAMGYFWNTLKQTSLMDGF